LSSRISFCRSRSGGSLTTTIETIKQILAKFALFHHALEIAVGGGNQARIHIDGCITANAGFTALPSAFGPLFADILPG